MFSASCYMLEETTTFCSHFRVRLECLFHLFRRMFHVLTKLRCTMANKNQEIERKIATLRYGGIVEKNVTLRRKYENNTTYFGRIYGRGDLQKK